MQAFELVFADVYGFNLLQTGLTFLGIFLGMIMGVLCDPLWRRLSCKFFMVDAKSKGKTDLLRQMRDSLIAMAESLSRNIDCLLRSCK